MAKILIDVCCIEKLIKDIEENSVPSITISQLKRLVQVEKQAEHQRYIRKTLGMKNKKVKK